MKTRSPSVRRAAPIHSTSCSVVAVVYRSGSGFWIRNMEPPLRWGPDWRTVRDSLVATARGCRPQDRYVAGCQAGVTCNCSQGSAIPAPTLGPVVQRPPTGTIPDAPGSYQFKDAGGRVIYVGKAASLRSRLSNYFGPNLLPRTAQMVATAETVEWIQVRNDVEALMLEYSLIKQHRPLFNIRLLDDKSYPFLAVTLDDQWRRSMVMRGQMRKGVRYFGPYGHAYAIRETLDLLLRTFPIRTCSDNKFARHERQGRPCLLGHIEKCSAPCVDAIDKAAYDRLVPELIEFLDGDTQPVVKRLERQMDEAASLLEFERAARPRDRLASVRKAIEK